MKCYQIDNILHNPHEPRPEGLAQTIKTCEEWCGEFREECRNALLQKSPVNTDIQKSVDVTVDRFVGDINNIYLHGKTGEDKSAITSYIRAIIDMKLC